MSKGQFRVPNKVLNECKFNRLSAREIEILLSIFYWISRIEWKDTEDGIFYIGYKDLVNMVSAKRKFNNKDFTNQINNIYDKCIDGMENPFIDEISPVTDEKVIEVVMSQEQFECFKLTKNQTYTTLNLSDVFYLNSKYSKRLYIELMKFNASSQFYVIREEDLAEKLGVPTCYTPNEAMQNVYKKAVDDLTECIMDVQLRVTTRRCFRFKYKLNRKRGELEITMRKRRRTNGVVELYRHRHEKMSARNVKEGTVWSDGTVHESYPKDNTSNVVYLPAKEYYEVYADEEKREKFIDRWANATEEELDVMFKHCRENYDEDELDRLFEKAMEEEVQMEEINKLKAQRQEYKERIKEIENGEGNALEYMELLSKVNKLNSQIDDLEEEFKQSKAS